jgi:hypothetical protein
LKTLKTYTTPGDISVKTESQVCLLLKGLDAFIAPNEKVRLADVLIGAAEDPSLRLAHSLRFPPPITNGSSGAASSGQYPVRPHPQPHCWPSPV